jgi:hypothetical protein
VHRGRGRSSLHYGRWRDPSWRRRRHRRPARLGPFPHNRTRRLGFRVRCLRSACPAVRTEFAVRGINRTAIWIDTGNHCCPSRDLKVQREPTVTPCEMLIHSRYNDQLDWYDPALLCYVGCACSGGKGGRMSETLRLYRYRNIFSGGRVVSRSTLLGSLEISPATLKRDLAKLRHQLHMPIVFDRSEP